MNLKDAINVRQRQYGFAKRDTKKNLLVTNNVFVCSSWFGFDRENGLAFLCHFDGERSTEEIPKIVKELNELAEAKLNIESYILNGSKVANWVRTCAVRTKIMQYAEELSICPHTPQDLGYSTNNYRSRVIVSADWLDWLREDYVVSGFRKVSKKSKAMSKAHGSA